MTFSPAPKPIPRPPKPRKPIAARGPRAWAPTTRAGTGPCAYCGRWSRLTWDHVIQRSIAPELREDPRNLVRACAACNVGRSRGDKPPWENLPAETRAFVLEQRGQAFAERYFDGVSPEGTEAPRVS